MAVVYIVFMCLATAFNVVWLAYIISHLPFGKKHRKERVAFIRSYKKGDFTVAFVPYFVLFFAGVLYTRTIIPKVQFSFSIFVDSFFDSLAKTLYLAGLRFDTGTVQAFMDSCKCFKTAIYIAFSIVVFNAVLFFLSFLMQRLSLFFATARRLRKKRTRKNTCFIYGKNPTNVYIYNSDKENEYPVKYIIDEFKDRGDDEYFSRGITYANLLNNESEAKYLKKYLNCKFKDQKELVMIINFEDDATNLSLCNSLLKEIGEYHKEYERYEAVPEKKLDKELTAAEKLEEQLDSVSTRLSKLSIYVFGDGTKDSLYYELESRGFGVIHYMNKYRNVGQGFLWDNPLVKYMDERHIDYAKGLLKPGVKATFALVGFGKMNRELFSNLVSGNQFATEDENGNPVPLQMDYYLYDKNENLFSKDLNYGYFRYEKFYKGFTVVEEDEEERKKKESKVKEEKEKYLPLAPLPANVMPIEDCDINSPEFFESLQKNLVASDERHLNLVFVSFGEDLENAELAKKIAQLGREWGISNLKVFVRMKHPKSNRALIERAADAEGGAEVRIYGDEDELYSLKRILSKTILKFGMLTDSTYQRVSKSKSGSVKDIMLNRLWYATRYNIDRISSCYSGINVKNMLGLMNLEVSSSDEGLLTKDAYDSIYQPEGKNSIIRNNLMFTEHMRWTAFMICNGYVPSTREQIRKKDEPGKKGKCHEERRHGNITTYDGLDEFARIVSEVFNNKPEDNDVKQFDAMIMENCPTILGMMGLGIKKKLTILETQETEAEVGNEVNNELP